MSDTFGPNNDDGNINKPMFGSDPNGIREFGSDPIATFGNNAEPAIERYDDSGTTGGDNSGADGDSSDRFERDDFGNLKYNRDGSPRKKRGRAKGWRANGKSSKARPNVLNVSGFEKLLLSIHGMMAALTKTPELALEDAEAKALAEAAADVAQYYPLDIAPEIIAWINLSMVAIPIYASRVYLIVERQKAEKAARARNITTSTSDAKAPVVGPSSTPNHGPRATSGFPEFKAQ